MIILRRARDRDTDRCRKHEVWHTFAPEDGAAAPVDCFGALRILDEIRLPAGGACPHHRPRDAEIVTYVREGALAHDDSRGGSGILQAGEFQRMTSGRGIRHDETNASRTDTAHVFQIWLRPSEAELEPGREEKRFSAAERRGNFRIVASPDARRGSLLLHQGALVYSAILAPGKHVVHELMPGRSAWLHLVEGEVTLDDIVLATGDGAGITSERAVSLTARLESEVLLVDLDG